MFWDSPSDLFVQKMDDGLIRMIVKSKTRNAQFFFFSSSHLLSLIIHLDITRAMEVLQLNFGKYIVIISVWFKTFENKIMFLIRCGHGMTYDIDHERCDLSKNIDCKHGERPNWNPPEGCKLKGLTMQFLSINHHIN